VATFSTTSDASAPILNQIANSVYGGRQAIFVFISPVVIISITVIPQEIIKKYANLLFFLSIVMLFIVTATNGAAGVKAWVDVIWGYTIQPSEFAKIAFILMLAKYLSRTSQPMSNRSEVLRTLLILVVPVAAIVSQGEMGTIIVLVFIFGVLLFFAGVKLKVLGGLISTLVVFIAIFYIISVTSSSENYRINRILAFFSPELYAQNDAYQQMQSMTAIGSGGRDGVGLFVDGSIYQLNYVPANWTDFIFSTIGEAFGFIWCTAVIGVYLLLVLRMLYLAAFTKDRFGQLVIIGIMAMFLYHIFQNIAMTIGAMPITGIPLPFISYGGSNLVSNMVCIGIVLNITKNRSKLSHPITPQVPSSKRRFFG